MTAVVWLHEDGLRLDDCADLPALFVFDDRLMRDLGYGLKRIVFIYETLLEMGVIIRRGDTALEVRRFAAEHHAETLRLRPTVCPKRRAIIAELGRHLTIEELPEPSFVNAPGRLDLQRFSRYWRRVCEQAMLPTIEQD
jgi:deoxyribodipyrimidine photo-lyase